MPYIKKDRRTDMTEIVDLMMAQKIKADGDLNYVLYKYYKNDINYKIIKNYIGELRQCAVEIERRLLGVYEDSEINENGDVQ